jgi:hypothetical protein
MHKADRKDDKTLRRRNGYKSILSLNLGQIIFLGDITTLILLRGLSRTRLVGSVVCAFVVFFVVFFAGAVFVVLAFAVVFLFFSFVVMGGFALFGSGG